MIHMLRFMAPPYFSRLFCRQVFVRVYTRTPGASRTMHGSDQTLVFPALNRPAIETQLGEDRFPVLTEPWNRAHDGLHIRQTNRRNKRGHQTDRRGDLSPGVTAVELGVIDELFDCVDACVSDLRNLESRQHLH